MIPGKRKRLSAIVVLGALTVGASGALFLVMTSLSERHHRATERRRLADGVDDFLLRTKQKFLVEARMVGPAHLELVSNHMRTYIEGANDAFVAVSPEAYQRLQEAIKSSVCRAPRKDIDVIIFANLASLNSRLCMQDVFDCAVQGRSEDVVLWKVLDAWRACGSIPSDAFKTLRNQTTDARSLRRFLPAGRERIDLQATEAVSRPQRLSSEGVAPLGSSSNKP
jgi:hypothetical protein